MLDSKQCEAFFAVAETGSIDAAGTKLSLTPSAVTLRLQALEKSLGQLLVIRARPCVLTQAGQKLFNHLQHTRFLENNFLEEINGHSDGDFIKIIIGTNADSLATWLLASINDVMIEEKIQIEILIDDQAQTHELLEKGIVNGCISTQKKAMRGCHALYLGKMRYQMLATQKFINKWFLKPMDREQLRYAPAVIFNHKDHLHENMLKERFGLMKGTYPCHYIPSSESFLTAIRLGLGYGLVPELQCQNQSNLIGVGSEMTVDVELYWHHWQQQSACLHKISKQLVANAHNVLN